MVDTIVLIVKDAQYTFKAIIIIIVALQKRNIRKMSSKMSGICPCGSENIWKMSGKMVKFTVRNFLCAEKTEQFLNMKEFWTNSG
jgi:hypothetical protein